MSFVCDTISIMHQAFPFLCRSDARPSQPLLRRSRQSRNPGRSAFTPFDRRSRHHAGFTLIELLVVIAIIAILSIVVVLTLNPSDMLRSARDSTRLSDMATLQSAINVWIADVSTGGGSLNFGSSTLTYLSLIDPTATTSAGSNCTALGFPAGYFHCTGPNFYKNTDGTGWIPLNLKTSGLGSSLGSLPIDPTNNASSGLYYSYATDGQTWKVGGIPESQKYANQITSFAAGSNQNLLGGFPNQGWVQVPGNPTFGTNTFSVMKYDAVCSDGKGNYLNDTTSTDTGTYHVYDNSNSPGNIPCTGSRQIAPLPGGYPIADIAEQPTAKAYCNSIGAHLLTNDEYMTIAMNAVQQASNWNGGVVGTSYVYSGHNNNSPAWASPADPNDANGYAGTNGPVAGGGTGTGGAGATNQKRTLTLSNGSVIWDMAGNVFQEVQRSNMNVGDNQTAMTMPSCSTNSSSTWVWCECPNATGWPTDPSTALTAGQTNPPNGWNAATNGMGQVETWGSGGSQGTTAFIRSGVWNSGSGDGVFTLDLNWYTGYTGYYVGFRCSR